MRKEIRLESLTLLVSIGIHDFELAEPQEYLIDITLVISSDYHCFRDDIGEAVDYDKLRTRVKKYLAAKHFNLQETVVQDVIAISFAVDERIEEVEVYARKPTVYPDCRSVGLRYRVGRKEQHNPAPIGE